MNILSKRSFFLLLNLLFIFSLLSSNLSQSITPKTGNINECGVLYNGDFQEWDDEHTPTGWQKFGDGIDRSLPVGENYYVSIHSDSYIYQNVTCDPNVNFNLSGIYNPSHPSGIEYDINAYVLAYSSNGTQLALFKTYTAGIPPLMLYCDNFVSVTGITPADTSFLVIAFQNSDINPIYYDDFTITGELEIPEIPKILVSPLILIIIATIFLKKTKK